MFCESRVCTYSSSGDVHSMADNQGGGAQNRRDVNVKVKVKFILEQATKAKKGSRGIALLFL